MISNPITADAIINLIAGADDGSMSAKELAEELGTTHVRQVIGALTALVREETLTKKNSRYSLRAHGGWEAPTRSRGGEIQSFGPTNGAKPAASGNLGSPEAKTPPPPLPSPPDSKKTPEKSSQEVSTLPNGTILVDNSAKKCVEPVDKTEEQIQKEAWNTVHKPVTTLEEIEAKVDENKSVSEAMKRLEMKLKAQEPVIPPLPNADMKLAILCKLELILEDSIANECQELAMWIERVLDIQGSGAK